MISPSTRPVAAGLVGEQIKPMTPNKTPWQTLGERIYLLAWGVTLATMAAAVFSRL